MDKNSRSDINPFTGKSHFDIVNDDRFLKFSYNKYYKLINEYNLLDDTSAGKLVSKVSLNLIHAVEEYLRNIGRYDYVEDYYEWEFHLLQSPEVNALCLPGGKIVVLSGILEHMNSEEDLAFILGHEMSHALLDHARTEISKRTAGLGLTTASWFGGLALDIMGHDDVGSMVRAASNIASITSEYFMFKPFGRDNEIEADKLGIILIYLAGYDINHVPDFWSSMSKSNPNNFDFFATHPTDEKRLQAMRETIWSIRNDKDFFNKPLLADSNFNASYNVKTEGNNKSSNFGIGGYVPVNSLNSSSNKVNSNFCEMCGNRVGYDDSFCTKCGHKLNSDFRCSKCGATVSVKDSFCSNCGNKL